MRSSAVPVGWRVKRAVWSRWHVLRFSLAKERPIKPPTRNGRKIGLVPIETVEPAIPLRNVRTFDQLPAEERDLGARVVVAAGLWLTKILPPHVSDLPSIDDDINVAIDRGLAGTYRDKFRAPVLPAECGSPGQPNLDALVCTGPYALFLERASSASASEKGPAAPSAKPTKSGNTSPEAPGLSPVGAASGRLQWDFSFLDEFEHHDALCSLGLKVTFEEAAATTGLIATEIDSIEYGVVRRGDPDWNNASLLAVCAATTHLSLTRHFNYVHLISANHWDVATRNCLDSDHPLYRLVWPHVANSLYTNVGITRSQLLPDGDFVNIFSFTHRGLMEYFDAMYEAFDVRMTDPEADWLRRGLGDEKFDAPTQRNLVEVFTLMHDHASRYIEAYYPNDQALHDDLAVAEWLRALDRSVPGGIGSMVEDPLTRAGLARLIGAFMYEGNTIHELTGTTLWDYQLWADRNPTRVYRNGRRTPIDVFQRMINNNFGLQLRRAQLLADYGSLALDPKGVALFGQFLDECQSLQDRYDAEVAGPWRMEPKNLEMSMNG